MSFVFLEILLPLIIAFLLGLLFGWLWWGWRRTKITYSEWETMRQKANRASSIDVDAELTELRTDRDRLQAEIDDHVCAPGDGSVGAGVLGLSGTAETDDADATSDEAPDDATAAPAADDISSEAAASEDTGTAEADSVETDSVEADSAEADSGETRSGERAVAGEQRHPYGEGSHAPFADDVGDMPDGHPIKGNVDSMLYHRPDSRVYASTGAEVWFDTAQRAEDNGFALAKSHPKDTVIAAADRPVAGGERHPYGEGSHAQFSDDKRAMPEGYPIKGNVDSMLYHREDSRSYAVTIAEVWFSTPQAAEAAGFALASSHPS